MRTAGLNRAGRRRVAVALVIAMVAGILSSSWTPASAAATPKVVLDPDDNYAFANHTEGHFEGLPIQYDIAQKVAAELPSVCDADIVVTRDDSQDFVDRSVRAAQMADADVSVTLSLNSLDGQPWGFPDDGGSSAFATEVPANLAFGTELTNQMGLFTTRPTTPVNEESTNGAVYPYPEFAALDSTYAQFFMMFLDHTFDFDVIQNFRDLMVDAIVTAIANTLQSQGFQCLGTYPSLPTAERLLQLRNLGYQRFLRYNAEPVSMSTGNFSTAEKVFTLPGVGDQVIDLTLNYNAQSGLDSPVGVGWTFAYGSFIQQYSDESVGVFLPDGHGLLYTPDGSGGFVSPAGAFATLTQPDETTFVWSTSTGTVLTYEQDTDTGRGHLVSTLDRQGNGETLTYSGDGALFPKLASITDQAGQVVTVATNDDGRVTGFTRPGGATYSLDYSADGDLVSLTNPMGRVREYVYDSEHRMTSLIGPDGVTFLKNVYDSSSRVVEQRNAFNQLRTIVFDNTAQTTTYSDTTGAVTVYHWNDLKQITKVVDPEGGVQETTYNSETLPATDIDPEGGTTTRSFDSSGQLDETIDPEGNPTSATYNSQGDLTSTTDNGNTGGTTRTFDLGLNGDGRPAVVTNPDSSTQTQTFNSFGDLTSSTDENGNTTTYSYDGRGNVTSVTDPLGRVSTMTYDLVNRLTSTTDARGRLTSFGYDAADNLTQTTFANGSTEARSYDVNDQLASITDRRGGVTTYERDDELNVVGITLPNGGVVTNTFDGEGRMTSTTDAEGNTTSFDTDGLGRITATTDANGNTSTTDYDLASRVIEQTDPSGASVGLQVDGNGRPVVITDQAGGTVSQVWDPVGRLTSRTDQLGRTTTRTYNFRDQALTETDAAGGVTTYSYDAAGRLLTSTDPAGAVTTYSYDGAGQLTEITDALGGVTELGYDAVGNVASVTDANGHTTTIAHDEMNQPVSETDANGNTTTYDYDAGSLVTQVTDALGHDTSFDYDAMGDLTSVVDPLGRTTGFDYDLNQRPVGATAPDGVVTEQAYDGVGNLTTVIRNRRVGETPSASVNVTNSYSYDSRNLLANATDPNGDSTTFGYNLRGLRTSETDPLGRVTSFTYDAVGNLATRTDGNGVTTTYGYDARDLLTGQDYSDSTPDTTFTYDAVGRQLTAANSIGAVTTDYDLLGRVTSQTDASGETLGMVYDAVGNRTQLALPTGESVGYEYDAGDRLTQLTSPLGVVSMAYDAADRLTGMTKPNGTSTATTYDAGDQLTRLLTASGSGMKAKTVSDFRYQYDSVGNVSSRGQIVGKTTTTTTYSYDPIRRLIQSASGPSPSAYTYDAAGNRIGWSGLDHPKTSAPDDPFTQTSVFDAAGQLIESTTARQTDEETLTDVTTYAYDLNGNRIDVQTLADALGQSAGTGYDFDAGFYYDAEGRLIATGPSDDRDSRGNGSGQREVSKIYDALGRLVNETRGDTTTQWTSDGLYPILATADDETSFYLRGVGAGLLGEETADNGALWYVTDLLGSVMGATDSKVRIQGQTVYSDYGINLDAVDYRMGFGGELAAPARSGDGIGNDTPVLNQYYARSYDSLSGSWLQQDPIGVTPSIPQTLAEYQFVDGNPSSNTDWMGFLSVGVSTTQYNISVGVASSSWNTSSLNGGNLQSGGSATHTLQPTITAQRLQPTISAQQLQPTYNPYSGYARRNPAAYGQVDSVTVSLHLGAANYQGGALQSSGTQGLSLSGYLDLGSGIVGIASLINNLGLYTYGARVAEYYRSSGVFVESYLRANPGATDAFAPLKVAGTWLDVAGIVGGLLSAPSDAVDAFGSNSSAGDRLQGSSGLAATGTAGYAYIAGTAASASAALVVGTAATAFWVGNSVGSTEAYQDAVSDELDSCWPNCPWHTPFTVTGSGVGQWWSSLLTDEY